jgi:hypothetical protein
LRGLPGAEGFEPPTSAVRHPPLPRSAFTVSWKKARVAVRAYREQQADVDSSGPVSANTGHSPQGRFCNFSSSSSALVFKTHLGSVGRGVSPHICPLPLGRRGGINHQTVAHHRRSVGAPRPHSFSWAAGAGHQFVRVCLEKKGTIWRTIASGGAEASNIVAGASMWPSSVVCVPGKLGRFGHFSMECARQSRVHFAVGRAVRRQRHRRQYWIGERNQP